ncbi:MAG: DMT family transporter [Desulfurivibrionaceae bacterium]
MADKFPTPAVHGLMVICAALVSTSFVVGKAITYGLDPAALTLARFIAAGLLFSPYIFFKYGLKPPSPKDLARYGAVSLAITTFFWCMFTSLRYTSSLNTSIIYTLVPGLAGIYGAVLLRERLRPRRVFALLFCMFGALWVIFRGNIDLMMALSFNKGDLIFLAGCLAMGLYTPLVRLLHRGEPMPVMTFWVMITGSVWLLILTGPKLLTIDWPAVEPVIWAGIIYLAVFTTIITFFLTQFSTIHIGPTRVMAYSYLYPLLVIIMEWSLGHGLPPLSTLPGVVIVLAAMPVLQRGGS